MLLDLSLLFLNVLFTCETSHKPILIVKQSFVVIFSARAAPEFHSSKEMLLRVADLYMVFLKLQHISSESTSSIIQLS